MKTEWPDRLTVGDRVRYMGRACTISELHGRRATLSDASGLVVVTDVMAVMCRPGFRLLDHALTDTGMPARSPSDDKAVSDRSRWWHAHIAEVITGLPPDAPTGARPRPQYDPGRRTLGEREAAKAEELARAGVHGASARTIRRKRQRYELDGIAGLADGRAGRRRDLESRWDPRVLGLVRRAVYEAEEDKPSVESVRKAVAEFVQSEPPYWELALPSRSTFHRLYAEMEAVGLLTGPDRWPGRMVELSSVQLPRLYSPKGPRNPLWLTFAMDVDTRVLLTVVAHPRPYPIEATAVLARMCVPPDLRANWPMVRAEVRTSRYYRTGVTGPLVRPQTVVIDSAVRARTRQFMEACRRHGIDVRQPRTRSASQRFSVTERLAPKIVALLMDRLCSEVADEARAAGWPVDMVQQMLDVWVHEVWTKGQLPPDTPDFGLFRTSRSPGGEYDALVSGAGWISMPLSPHAYLDLFPAAQRKVGPTGLSFRGRRYDDPALDGLRHCTDASGGRLAFDIRWDPYDTRHIWLRTPENGWVTVPSVSSKPSPVPTRSSRTEDAALPARTHDAKPSVTEVPAQPGRRRTQSSTWETPDTDFDALGQVPPADAPDRIRVAYHAQLPLLAPDVVAVIDRAEELILLNRYATGARPALLVCGSPGTGKTTALLELARRHTEREILLPRSGSTPVVHVQLPPSVTPRTLLTELAREIDAPVRARATTADLTHQVSQALRTAGTGLVLVDEFHYLHTPPGFAVSTPDVVDYLCDQVPATFVFAGIMTPTRATGPRSRRLIPLALGPTPPGPAWHDVITQTEEALRLRKHVPGSLPDMAEHLHHITGGTVQRLGYLVRSGAIRAIRDGTESLNRELLDTLAGPWLPEVDEPSHSPSSASGQL
ncbi:AAA family ATPase [Streptomyces hokutonensis]|uniref:AAA family ATPase n=1 Tax=Streptomyces hokutonensis TaxID=1306990 RepID=UPI0033EA5911